MQDAGQEPGGEDEALAWRNDLALRLIRALLVIFVASGVVVWFAIERVASRNGLAAAVTLAAIVVGIIWLVRRTNAKKAAPAYG